MESTKKDMKIKQYISSLVQNILVNYKLINFSVHVYDCIIIDESESALNQYNSTTHNENINDTNTQLMKYISKSKCVIFADAFLSDRTLSYVKYIHGEKSLYINTYKESKKAFELKPDQKLKGGGFQSDMSVDLQNKEY